MSRPFLERREGCTPGDEQCFGPDGEYWTLFGAPVPDLEFHAYVALGVAAVLAGIVATVRYRRGWRGADAWWTAAVFGATWLVTFLILVYTLGSMISY